MRSRAVTGASLMIAMTLCATGRAAPLFPKLEARPFAGEPTIRVDFDWLPPCRVPVRRVVERPAPVLPQASEMTFDLVISAAGEERLRVDVTSPTLVSVDGAAPQRAPPPRVAAALAEGALWPAFHVSPRGAFVGARDVDAAIAGLLARAPLPPEAPERERLRATLASEGGRARLRRQIEGVWNDWAGSWAALRATPGKSSDRNRVIEDRARGVKVRVRGRLAVVGALVGDPELVLLELVETLDDADARKLLGAARTASWRRQVLAAVDPALGRAHRVRATLTTFVDGRRGEEIHDTMFRWGRAEGCAIRALAGLGEKYRNQPMFVALESYALAAIGELPPHRDRATRELVNKLIGGGEDWRATLLEVMAWPASVDEEIRRGWRTFQRGARAQGKKPDPEVFARDIAEELADY